MFVLAGVMAAPANPNSANGSLAGVVRDRLGPVPGAVVRVQATQNSTVTENDGRFRITGLDDMAEVRLTAWAPGYYITRSAPVPAGSESVEMVLTAHTAIDNSNYRWLLVDQQGGKGEAAGCVQCHSRSGTALTFDLPADEWRDDAHGRSGSNPRFLSMYLGTDLAGNRSPPTRYRLDREYGPSPIRPDPDQLYFGPGYRLDFPETAGNCAACHMPMAAVNAPYGTDPTTAGKLGEEGIGCDFCHKVWDVRINPATGIPFPNMPGVLSFLLRRPASGHQLFIGPFDDVAPGEDTCSPLQRESAVCAPCHFGTFWSTVVYSSFAEWLDSPYSDPDTGQTCQDCHMPASGATYFVRPDMGGLARDPAQLHSHRMPGATDAVLLQRTVDLDVATRIEGNTVVVDVAITNVGAGHYVPTDSPLRHLILVVRASNRYGLPLALDDGPRIPEWGGVGEPADGAYAGLPGTIYARVLEELSTRVAPTAAYWNPTRVVSDNRIPPLATTASSYVFERPSSGDIVAQLEVVLVYRRAFRHLMELKGWHLPDVVMARHTETVQLTPQEMGP